MIKRYLSPDENAAGGSGISEATEPKTEVKSTPNFASLSKGMFEVGFNAKAAADDKKIEQSNVEEVAKAEPTVLSTENKETTEEKAVEKKLDAPEGKVEVEAPTELGDAPVETPTELSLENIEGSSVEEKPFVSMSKELFGAEIEDDSYESFSAATKKALVEAEERGKNSSIQKELATLPPEAQVDFLLLKSGLSREEINNPTQVLDNYIAMSAIDLVRADLKLNDLPEATVEKEIEIFIEKGLIDHEAEKLKAGLKQQREQVLEERKELAQRVATEYEANQKVQKANEIESMNKAFNTVTDFMGIPVNEASRAALAKQYSEGGFDNIFNDPQAKAELILFKKFGETALKMIRNSAFQEGREKVTKHLSNIPEQVQSQNSTVAHKTTPQASSGFGSLKGIFN